MALQEFAWKAPGRSPHYRVTVSDDTLAIEQDGRRRTIGLAEIARAYVQVVHAPAVSYLLHVEVVDRRGQGVTFHDSGHGVPDADALTCRDAASALLRSLAPHTRIYDCGRPDKPFRFVMAAAVLLFLVALMWALLRFVFSLPRHADALGGMLAICFVFGSLWSWWKTTRRPAVPARSVLKTLAGL